MQNTSAPLLIILLISVGSLLGLFLGGLLAFAIVRAAVLSALRKHHDDLPRSERAGPR